MQHGYLKLPLPPPKKKFTLSSVQKKFIHKIFLGAGGGGGGELPPLDRILKDQRVASEDERKVRYKPAQPQNCAIHRIAIMTSLV